MNVKLLRKIQAHILEEPRRYWQNKWLMRNGAISRERLPAPPCGTVGCIAGWACQLTGNKRLRASESIRSKAKEVLGISEPQANRLFSSANSYGDWPFKYQDAYAEALTPEARAKVGSERIDHFIKTKGAE